MQQFYLRIRTEEYDEDSIMCHNAEERQLETLKKNEKTKSYKYDGKLKYDRIMNNWWEVRKGSSKLTQ